MSNSFQVLDLDSGTPVSRDFVQVDGDSNNRNDSLEKIKEEEKVAEHDEPMSRKPNFMAPEDQLQEIIGYKRTAPLS